MLEAARRQLNASAPMQMPAPSQGPGQSRPPAMPDNRIAAEKAVEATVRLRERLQQILQELNAAAQENLKVMDRMQKAVDEAKRVSRASRLGKFSLS